MEIVDTKHIKGFQNLETQAKIFESSRYWHWKWQTCNFASRYEGRGYFFRFLVKTLLLSAIIKNGTKTIFVTYNGLNDAKQLYTKIFFFARDLIEDGGHIFYAQINVLNIFTESVVGHVNLE